ncbi:T9SS type A sorting domain-containing protein [Aquimarina sp. RZ0]|uniref:T9SS type A sorting domain-containing protein n=1 Tax=Aquimarina sp. RZ0 TaxID=2607730 RepID=UPI0011F17C7C|nr:T9SS type A sorting domain-containing protein [Aquimarina sp. RZ0]KAA1246290.1 T9SS type A sorting domain-containing protein [Aquimarina sp. RZ0]
MNKFHVRSFKQKNTTTSVLFFFMLALLSFTKIHAKNINFDAKYGNNGNVFLKIQKAIDEASAGDVIIFNSNSYDLKDLRGLNILTISKAITIKGKAPRGFDPMRIGSSGILTSFKNVPTFAFRSNNIKFMNISLVRKNHGEGVYDILIDARHSTYLEPVPQAVTQLQYKGIEFKNVTLNGSAYSVHSGNGIGIKMINTSIINYRRTGYWANRFGRVDSTPMALFKRCEIIPEDTIGFDDRAVSYDAGNSEYPVVWDTNNTTFDTCKINDSGIALSRCRNFTIKNCTFNDRVGAVDLVHIEEFSNNIKVINNTFNCQVPNVNLRTRISQLDRDLQPVRDIEFKNNKIVGSYNFFISAYATSDIRITGNDFTKANAIGNNSIDFAYYESRDREPIDAELLSNDITVTDNPGLGLLKNKGIRVQLPRNNARFVIKGYKPSQRTITRPNPIKAVVPDGIYEIVNKKNGKKLTAPSTGTGIVTTNGNSKDSQWKITFNPPYSYFIQNVGNKKYMETHVGYTEFDVITNQPQNVFPFLINYGENATLPFWSIIKHGNDFEIFPGGNERQSVFSTDGSITKLIFTIAIDSNGVRSNLELGDEAQWDIRPVSTDTEAPIGSVISLKKSGGDKRFISAVGSLDQDLYANQNRIFGNGQKFRVEKHPLGKGVALRSLASNKCIRVFGDNANAIVDALGGDGSWTQFEWKSLKNNQVALKSLFSNKWLQAPHNKDITALYARGNAIGSWETFNWEIVTDSRSIDTQKDEDTVMYPTIVNAGDDVTISTLENKNNNSIEVYSIDGRLVKREVSASTTTIINTNTLTSGLYLVKISGGKALKLLVN